MGLRDWFPGKRPKQTGSIDSGRIERLIERGRFDQARQAFDRAVGEIDGKIDHLNGRFSDLEAQKQYQLDKYRKAKAAKDAVALQLLREKIETVQQELDRIRDQKVLLYDERKKYLQLAGHADLLKSPAGGEALPGVIDRISDRMEQQADRREEIGEAMAESEAARERLLGSAQGSGPREPTESGIEDDDFERRFGLLDEEE